MVIDTNTWRSRFKLFVPALPDVIQLSHAEKDTLILALWQRLEEAERRIAELEAKLAEPPKTPNNSSLPPSKGEAQSGGERKRNGPRQGSLGRKGGGRPLPQPRCDSRGQGAELCALPNGADRCRSGAARSVPKLICRQFGRW